MAGRRLEMDRLQELVRMHRLKVGARECARLLGLSPNTERRYRDALAEAGLLHGDADTLPLPEVLRDAVLKAMPRKVPEHQRSTVAEWTDQIKSLAESGLGAKEIRRRLRKTHDFQGSYSQVKRIVRALRKEAGVRAEDVAIPVQTAPGEVAQVDFGYVGKLMDPSTRTVRKAWVFVAVLGHSRFMWAKIAFDQTIETWLRLHVEFIEAIGGVPRVFVPDNLKSAVIKAAFTPSDTTALNRSYRELARHYGFMIDPAPPFSPEKKGKVEAGVKYVKNSVLNARDGEDALEVQHSLEEFLDEDANQRTHATTGRVPSAVLNEERASFLPLPEARYEPVVWRTVKVQRDTHVQFDKRFYSVPWHLVGRDVWLRATKDSVWIYAEEERVATHSRHGDDHRSTTEAHLPEGRRDLRHRSREHWELRGDAMSPEVGELVRAIFDSDDVLYGLRTAQAVVRYLEDFPPERANAAAKRALFYGVTTYVGIKQILTRALDKEPLPNATLANSGVLDAPRFARNIDDLHILSGPVSPHEPH